ncbi:MAG: MarR family transcriptional regulator [bacterium]|nr:MarR family transcriptional regulator [bacterium]
MKKLLKIKVVDKSTSLIYDNDIAKTDKENIMINRFETFVTMMNKINRSIQIIKNKEMEDYGLKGSQVMCLYQLKQHEDGVTSKDLASLCGEDKAAISRTLAKLEEAGLVSFIDNLEGKKRYRTLIKLTKEGRTVCEKINEKIGRVVENSGEGFSEEEREVFYRVLSVIAENLERQV